MTDKLISDLGSIGAAIADNTATEVQRNGQTTTEQALGSDWKTYIKSWIAKADVGLGNVDNTSDATKNAASATLTNKTLTAPIINSPTGIVKADVGLGSVSNNAQLTIANNLSDLNSTATARVNLGFNISARRPYRSGRWYVPRGMFPSATSFNGTLTVRLIPLFVDAACTITDLGISLTTASSGQNLQLGIYASDASTDAPTGTPLATSGNISTTTTGRISGALGSPLAISSPGLYWVGVEMSDGTMQISTPTTGIYSSDVGNSSLTTMWGSSAVMNTGLSSGASTFGTWPDLTSASPTATNGAPAFAFKVS